MVLWQLKGQLKMYTGYRDGQRTKETICRRQKVLKGNAARGC